MTRKQHDPQDPEKTATTQSFQTSIDAWVEGIPRQKMHYSFQRFYADKGPEPPRDRIWVDDDGNPVDTGHYRRRKAAGTEYGRR